MVEEVPPGRWTILGPAQWPLSLQSLSRVLECGSREAGAESTGGAQGTRPLQGEDTGSLRRGETLALPPSQAAP